MKTVRTLIRRVAVHTDKPWYPYLIALLAALDLFIVVVPTDGFTLSAVVSRPKRWLAIALIVGTGSCLGAVLLGAIVYFDVDLLQTHFPAFFQSEAWQRATELLNSYGLWAIGIGSMGPFPLQPFVIVPLLAEMNPWKLLAAFAVARFSKFILICWCASHAPRLLHKIWGVDREIAEFNKDVGEKASLPPL